MGHGMQRWLCGRWPRYRELGPPIIHDLPCTSTTHSVQGLERGWDGVQAVRGHTVMVCAAGRAGGVWAVDGVVGAAFGVWEGKGVSMEVERGDVG